MKRLFILISFLALLVACDSADERAEKHYQTAIQLIEDGDHVRALLELRNVFNLNGHHREARRLYAETVLAQGRVREAYSQYLRLREQYPEDIDANRQLAILAVGNGAVEQARPYLDVVLSKAPEDLEAQAIDAWVKYQLAARSDRIPERDAALGEATALLEADPTLVFARQAVIAHLMSQRQWADLIVQVDDALIHLPNDTGLFRLKLAALEQLGQGAEIEQTLLTMTERFPQDASVGQMLVRWYVGNRRPDEAEAWLRNQIDPKSDRPQARLALVNFLNSLRGADVALEELTRIETLQPLPTDVAENFGVFASLRAAMMFNLGDREQAILRLEGLIAEGGFDTTETNRMKVGLAQMLEQTGNQVGARALVSEVLEQDATQVGALKMQAAWQIATDDTDGAIASLKLAQEQEPKALDVLSLLAAAYERDGSRELMLDTLELAVEVSNRAPKESLELAHVYFQDEQFRRAEEVLIESLRLNSSNVDLLHQLGKLHIELADWSRAAQEVSRLRSLVTRAANAAADDLEATLLLNQNKTEDLMRFVESRVVEGRSREATAIRALVLSGALDEAQARAEAFFANRPEDPAARFVLASVLSYTGQDDRALALFEEVVAQDPTVSSAWSSIFTIHQRRGDTEQARAALDRAAAAVPDDINIKWERAGYYERVGDTEKAIALYEEIYAENSGLAVIANNLASLLSTTRSDEESLERAYVVARRLRGTDEPAFSDTYGWIAFRRGELGEAIAHLEKAEAGLPNDPSVAYHLGRAYAAARQIDDAKAKLERAKLLIDEGARAYPGLQQAVTEAIDALEAPVSEASGN